MMRRAYWRGRAFHVQQAALLSALLLGCLATTVVLAYRTQVAARFRQVAVERTLQGDADFAAWHFASMSSERLDDALEAAFAPIASGHVGTGGSAPAPGVLARSIELADPCPDGAPPRSIHRVDLRAGAIASTGAGPAPAERTRLIDAVRQRATRGAPAATTWGVITTPLPGVGRVLAYAVLHDASGAPVLAYAFPTCLLTGRSSVYAQVASTLVLLPPRLGHSVPDDSLFSVRVVDAAGRVLFRSPVQYGGIYAGRAVASGDDAGVTTEVVFRPDLARATVLGNLPRSQIPLLMLLMAVSAALLGAALVLINREERFTRMRDEFLAGISHELRTPLAQIRIFAELLRMERPRTMAERERCLAIIDQESRRLTQLVDNILQFTRGERTSTGLPLVRSDLALEVEDAVDSFRPLAAGRRVTIRSTLAAGVEAEIAPHAIRQVLLNVLDNAVKFGPAGQTVWVTLARHGERARIVVDDEGPGIPRRERRRVWRPFYRLSRNGAAPVTAGGSGLGLAVVRDLVTQMRGRVWIDAAPRGGARIIIEFPVAAETGANGDAVPRPPADAIEHAH